LVEKKLDDIVEKQEEVVHLYCDNKSVIAMAKNLVYHSRTRHIAIKHHFIKKQLKKAKWSYSSTGHMSK
jgi:hypothetical protein